MGVSALFYVRDYEQLALAVTATGLTFLSFQSNLALGRKERSERDEVREKRSRSSACTRESYRWILRCWECSALNRGYEVEEIVQKPFGADWKVIRSRAYSMSSSEKTSYSSYNNYGSQERCLFHINSENAASKSLFMCSLL
ncbi:hypothetical protein V6N13_034908 [Hibiscus sabdariffa]